MANGPAPTGPGAGPSAAANGPGAAVGATSPDEGMPGVAGQLVRVLSAPRPTANGTYQVTVALHPESLGTVQATVTAGQDQVSIRLVAATGDGATAIRQALPQLHEALAASGQRASVSLAGGGPGGGAGHSIGHQGAGPWDGGGFTGGSPGGAPGGGSPGGARVVAPVAGPATATGPVMASRQGQDAAGAGGTRRLVDVRV